MIFLFLILGISCIVHISSQLFQLPSHSYILQKFPLDVAKKSRVKNINDPKPDSLAKRIFDERAQLTQLNKVLKKPVYNFANLFRHNRFIVLPIY